MNLQEAYSTLELSPNASQDEAKKKYKGLAKKFHPDINKEPDADDKFKKINEAYSCIQSGKGTDEQEVQQRNPFEGFGFNRKKPKQPSLQHIQTHTTISFKESVLGCKKEISFSRKTKCSECEGQGEQQIHNGCDKCHGLGTITRQQGNMVFTQTCDKCSGKINTQPCLKCKSTGVVDSDVSLQVNIPGGVINGNTLRLSGMGNYFTHFMGMEQHTDAHLIISVIPQGDLKIINNDVISTIQISLIEAIIGCNKNIDTIEGMKEIIIKPKSRNNDEVFLPKLGVIGIGCQKVILDVIYPDNIDDLVQYLSEPKTTTSE